MHGGIHLAGSLITVVDGVFLLGGPRGNLEICVGAEVGSLGLSMHPALFLLRRDLVLCGLWWTASCSRRAQRVRAAGAVYGSSFCSKVRTGSSMAPSHLELIRVTRDITV